MLNRSFWRTLMSYNETDHRNTAATVQQLSNVFIGCRVDESMAAVKGMFPDFDVYDIENGMMTTMDLRSDRIRVWYDAETNLITEIVVG
ncbi:MAG: hypothetical protein EOP83_21845 [Verrucomicrobiaceae bacterium]|nr:MAG: hypothetical protein EOP83_21845 [Verrucomicrobiaceae bacterium]